MKDIKQLIDKYFEGLTSSSEEKQLREYFKTENEIPEEFLHYQPLFAGMEMKRRVHKGHEMEILLPVKVKNHKKNIWISVSSVAAALLLLISLKLSFNKIENSDYVIVNGKRYNDKEMAQQYAKEAFDFVKTSDDDIFLALFQ